MFAVLAAVCTICITLAAPALASGDPEFDCRAGRYNAARHYVACHQKAMWNLVSGRFFSFADLSKCSVKLASAWAKLQTRASGTGSTCDAARFLDNGDGTVTDNSTGLQWEKKDNLDGTMNFGNPHDADNKYTWSASGTAADGTAVTDCLSGSTHSLNNGGPCFAGQCDWRLPTFGELYSIFDRDAVGCGDGFHSCIDPIFGPTAVDDSADYWSSTTSFSGAGFAWVLGGHVRNTFSKTSSQYVRAVRGGLY